MAHPVLAAFARISPTVAPLVWLGDRVLVREYAYADGVTHYRRDYFIDLATGAEWERSDPAQLVLPL